MAHQPGDGAEVATHELTTFAPGNRWHQTLGVLSVTAGLLALTAGLIHLSPPEPPSATSVLLPWWVFAVAFALTESVVMHIQVRREAQAVSLSEVPLVLGLFFAAPAALLVGRLVGSLLIFVFQRRSSPLKVVFNAALICAETCTAVAIYRYIASDVAAPSPREWLAAYAAVLLANALGAAAIGLVIAIYEGGLRVLSLLREAVTGQAVAPLVVTLALVAVSSLAADPDTAWLLIASAGVLLLGYRGYSALSDRHLNLERLYHFSQAVTSSPKSEAVLNSVLVEAKKLLRSDHAELTFPGPDTSTTTIRIVVGPAGRTHRDEADDSPTDGWLQQAVVRSGAPVVMPRNSRDGDIKAWLVDHCVRDAIAVPLPGTSGNIGMLLVANRLGEVRTYDSDDVLLLETVANHASIALQKGELMSQLEHDALHDSLTSLPNRNYMHRQLHLGLHAVEAGDLPGLAVMILDLDGFKDVNDTLGHQQGDVLLIEVGQRLLTAVGGEGCVARLGGDEFAVVVPGLHDPELAREMGQRLIAALEEAIVLEGLQIEIGASVGVSLAPQQGTDPSILLKRADAAMYDAKGSTEGVMLYQPRVDTTSARRLAMVSELRVALQCGEIEVFVQPQADTATGRVCSVEALARWSHATLGSVRPDEFIPIAERSGLIKPLTLAVLDASLAGCATWRDLGVSVAVNLSARSLLDSGLVMDIDRLLQRHSVAPQSLVLEVTESAVMADPARALALLEQLHTMGVRLSVDDFGTGYSSLSYLKRLPVQEVKIDRSFVTDLVRGGEDFAIVRSIVDLGTHLGLEVVAEGVENQQTWDLLRDIGCTRVQGWHLARPMPIDQAAGWLRERGVPHRQPTTTRAATSPDSRALEL